MPDAQPPTISREAGDKAKGFRLQKLRAAKLMLKAAESRPRAFFYAAIEVVEDVSITASDAQSSNTQIEEDKNFNAGTNFTIFSAPVRNTLVSFFDIFTNQWRSSDNLVLSFYTTAGVGKETKTLLDDGTKLTLPDEPVLKILKSGDVDDNVVELVRLVVIDEYRKQYETKKTPGHLQTLVDCPVKNFKAFLASISWFFSSENEVELKNHVLQLIKDSKYHNFKVANKEEIILSLILERLDEQQALADFASRFMTSSDLELIFRRAESEVAAGVLDPVWALIKQIELEITDKRNLEEKIRAVIPGYPPAKLKLLARMACRSKMEQANGNKSFLALKYRTYESCEEFLCDASYSLPTTGAELDAIVSDLQIKAAACIDELKKDYTYTVSNNLSINGVVMDLVDSCFVSFDKNPNGK